TLLAKYDVDSNPNHNKLCGKKIRVFRGGKSVDVTIMDKCPGGECVRTPLKDETRRNVMLTCNPRLSTRLTCRLLPSTKLVTGMMVATTTCPGPSSMRSKRFTLLAMFFLSSMRGVIKTS